MCTFCYVLCARGRIASRDQVAFQLAAVANVSSVSGCLTWVAIAMASSDLTWMLVRDHSAFLVKRHNLRRAFSREPNNIRNLHTPASSGLAQSRTVAIQPATKNALGVNLTLERQRVSQLKVADRFVQTKLPCRKGPRHAALALSAQIQAYRPDLLKYGLARLSKFVKSYRKVKSPKYTKRGKRSAKHANKTKVVKVEKEDDDMPALL